MRSLSHLHSDFCTWLCICRNGGAAEVAQFGFPPLWCLPIFNRDHLVKYDETQQNDNHDDKGVPLSACADQLCTETLPFAKMHKRFTFWVFYTYKVWSVFLIFDSSTPWPRKIIKLTSFSLLLVGTPIPTVDVILVGSFVPLKSKHVFREFLFVWLFFFVANAICSSSYELAFSKRWYGAVCILWFLALLVMVMAISLGNFEHNEFLAAGDVYWVNKYVKYFLYHLYNVCVCEEKFWMFAVVPSTKRQNRYRHKE